MTISLLLQMVGVSLAAVIIYTFIGFIPGTDETSVLMPISLALVLAGTPAILVLTFFIASVVTLNLTNLMPTALVGLPGGVLSAPMIEHALIVKKQGQSALIIKKMAAASLIGTVVSIPTSFVLAQVIAPYAQNIQPYASLLFVLGAVFLAMLSKNRILSLLTIIPLALLFMALRHLYWGTGIVAEGTTITTSFFLGITIGPLVVSLLSLLNKDQQKEMIVEEYNHVQLDNKTINRSLNPFKTLTKEEGRAATLSSILSSFLFFLSPVGLILLFGESIVKRTKASEKKPAMAMTTMSALAQSTYLSGIIIPLFALGIPLSPTAIGPGNALFNAPPVYGLENNLHYQLGTLEFVLAAIIGAVIASAITYVLIHRFAFRITHFIMKKIPHEAVLAIFLSFIFLLAYMDAGLINVFGVLLIAVACGSLNKLGVNYGVQFMTLYAAPQILAWLT